MEFISGGVTAPKGFLASGIHCGIRKNKSKKDLALIYAESPCAAAAVYTTNLVKGAPLIVTAKNLEDGRAQAVICNSGIANTCNADGIEKAEKTCELLGKALKISPSDVIVASTGVIGQPLCLEPIEGGMEALIAGLGDNSEDANIAIMTTDTVRKSAAVSFLVGGKECRIGGIAKGSGMIAPNMATMLVFVTTDVGISPTLLKKAISEDVKSSFNMVSVDGDTSTNDMLSIMASGKAGVIITEDYGYAEFRAALSAVTTKLCREIARDGEGATKLIECRVSGAKTDTDARLAAKSVINSSLFKAAMFGADANWGRVFCALGYSGADIDVTKIDVTFLSPAGEVKVAESGAGKEFSEEIAKRVLLEKEITVLIELNDGEGSAVAWGCDLTYDYVKINGDYRT